MDAVYYNEYCNDFDVEKLQYTKDYPKPILNKNSKKEMLIEVKSVGLNPIDYKMMMGWLKIVQPNIKSNFVPCWDFAGIVKNVGKNSNFEVGDKVFGMTDLKCGALAKYLKINEKYVCKIPDNLDFNEAASLPLTSLTSYQALMKHGKLHVGQRILILNGSGGTGSVAIQIARFYDCFVATTCSENSREFVESLGPDLIINYNQESWYNLSIYDEKFDIVYDCIGDNPNNYHFAKQVLKTNGKFVTIVGDKEQPTTIGTTLNGFLKIVQRNIGSLFSDPSYHWVICNPNSSDLEEICYIIEEGGIVPTNYKVFNLENYKEAFERLHERKRGKIIIAIDQVS